MNEQYLISKAYNFINKNEINNKDLNGNTLLIVAATKNYVNCVKLLIEHSADLEIINDNGENALMCASKEGNIDIVDLLIKSKVSLDTQDKHGETALIMASRQSHNLIVEYLINNGADLNIQSQFGISALMVTSNYNITKLLVSGGIDLDLKNDNGNTALFLAVNDYDIVELLIKSGCDIQNKNIDGLKAIDVAMHTNQIPVIFLLNPDTEVDKQDEYGNTFLINACEYRRINYIIYLYNKKADFFLKNNSGKSAFDILQSKSYNNTEIVALIENLLLTKELDCEDDISISL